VAVQTQLEGGLCANERSQSNKAQVEAIVSEVAKLYEDGQLNQRSSYDENLRVRYDLVRKTVNGASGK